eukprot:COSAG01_NODE_10113_length_2248_cov_2.683108_2_plen_74_part_00
MHTDHAASSRLSWVSLIGSIFLVSVVSVFPAIRCAACDTTILLCHRPLVWDVEGWNATSDAAVFDENISQPRA